MKNDEQGAPAPARKKVLAEGDYRFLCVRCGREAIIIGAGLYAIANRLIGASGWRVFMRLERDPKENTGLRCPECTELRLALEALPHAPPAAAPEAA